MPGAYQLVLVTMATFLCHGQLFCDLRATFNLVSGLKLLGKLVDEGKDEKKRKIIKEDQRASFLRSGNCPMNPVQFSWQPTWLTNGDTENTKLSCIDVGSVKGGPGGKSAYIALISIWKWTFETIAEKLSMIVTAKHLNKQSPEPRGPQEDSAHGTWRYY